VVVAANAQVTTQVMLKDDKRSSDREVIWQTLCFREGEHFRPAVAITLISRQLEWFTRMGHDTVE
jgi:hypothetical protein